MASSTMDKKCFLCNVKQIGENYLVDSQESSLILCQILSVPHLRNNLKKCDNIKYCHTCKKRILKIQESLELKKKLEKEILDEKYLITIKLEENYCRNRNHSNEMYYSQAEYGAELVNELRFKSIKSKLAKVVQNKICRKVFTSTKNFRIMKNITILKKLEHKELEGSISKLVIPKELTTLMSYSLISTEKQSFLNFPLPNNCSFKDVATNSPFIHVEFPFTSNRFDFDEIKFEESNNQTVMKDPFEGIVPESDFVAENLVSQTTVICETRGNNFQDNGEDEHRCTDDTSISSNGGETKIEIDVTDPFEGIVHDLDFITENLKTPKMLVCGTCEIKFVGHDHLNKHCGILNGSNSIRCNDCSKVLILQAILKDQTPFDIRRVEKLLKCRSCKKIFPDRSILERHIRIHAVKKNCKYCEKTFYRSHELKRHECTHTGEKRFKCSYCEKGFSYNCKLTRHERIHTGEKPFKCSYCEMTFTQKYEWVYHEHTHTGTKPTRASIVEKYMDG